MTNFNIYFNGTCIDTLKNTTARKARNSVNRGYTHPEQCVVVEADIDQATAVALSKKLYVVDEAFEAETVQVMADAELTGAARKRSGETICFSNNIAAGTHGIQVLTTDRKWIVLLEGVTEEEAREFMRNFNGRPDHVPAKVINTREGVVSDFPPHLQKVTFTKRQGFEKRFVDTEAAQQFIEKHNVQDCEIVDFNYALFAE